MIKKLSTIYGRSYFEISGKAYLNTFTTVTLARLGTSFIKSIPGVGTYIGGSCVKEQKDLFLSMKICKF